MTLAFDILCLVYGASTSFLLVSRWYWKRMYQEDERYIKELDAILDRLIGPVE